MAITTSLLLDVYNFACPSEEPDPKYEKPRIFQEAWNHPDTTQRVKCHKGIKNEFHNMTKRGVWRRIKKKDIPSGQRCLKSKWVFKINRNGAYQERLVSCGYNQIPEVDFTENYSPVVHDITFHLLLIEKMIIDSVQT